MGLFLRFYNHFTFVFSVKQVNKPLPRFVKICIMIFLATP
jgi:hypothetical protein